MKVIRWYKQESKEKRGWFIAIRLDAKTIEILRRYRGFLFMVEGQRRVFKFGFEMSLYRKGG